MSYYYYPLCTKDFTFENIFASESISPHIFYSKRGFGIDYFYKIPKAHHEKAIILFAEPPVYETGSDNSNIIKFILAIDNTTLDETEIINVDNGIVAYTATIYLNKNNFKILFFSDVDQKVVCLRAETSLPTKGLGKYAENFELIAESDCRKFDLFTIERLTIDTKTINDAISYDRLYNSFKGFIYGAVAGMLTEKSKEEIAIKRSFQEIINCFTELRSRKDTEQKGLGARYSKTFGISQSPLNVCYDKLIRAIAISEELYYDLYPPPKVSETDIASFLLTTKRERLKTLEEALRYVSYRILDDELFGTNRFEEIKDKYLTEKGIKDPSIHFANLKILAAKYAKGSTKIDWNSDKKVNVNTTDDFKEALHELSIFSEQNLKPKKETRNANLEGISINAEGKEITIKPGFGELKEHELQEYQMIVNVILKTPRLGKRESTKEQILSIVEETGNKTNKGGGKQTRLYRYLNNEINDYSIEKATSIVMKNFVGFIFNADSIEKLENYADVKEIDQKWISTSFWCLFNGFANTSGIFLKQIFGSSNERLQNEIDHYLNENFPKKVFEADRLGELVISEPPPPVYKIESEKKEDRNGKTEEFYNKYVKGKIEIDLEKFISIFQKKDPDEILNDLKKQYNVLKKDGRKLVELFTEEVSSQTLF